MTCLLGAKFNMEFDVLRQITESDSTGSWIINHDPDSNEIIRTWQPDSTTPAEELDTFPCTARAIVDGGIRVAGTTERFGDMYEGVDYVRLNFPPNVRLSRRDMVTNIRGSNREIIWIEEERDDQAPTVFNVNGISPILDPFGRVTEYMALLERAEMQ